MTNELKLCRVEHDKLLVSSERSHTLYEENDIMNKMNLQKILEENESMKHKLYDQKCTMKAHRQTERGFRNDIEHFEISNRSLDLREKNNNEKYENVVILNNNLKNKLEKQETFLNKQNENIVRLNALIEDMVPKAEYDDCILRLEAHKRRIENDMVDLHTHQNLKDKYSELVSHVEKNTVDRKVYEDAILQSNLLLTSIKDDYIPLEDYVILEKKLEVFNDDKNTLSAKLSVFEREQEINYGELRESEAKCRSLKNRIEQTEAELMAVTISGEAMKVNIKDLHHEIALITEAKEEVFQKNISIETSQSVLMIQLGNLKSNLRKEIDEKMRNEKLFKAKKEILEEENKKNNQNLILLEDRYRKDIHEIRKQNESDLITISKENNEILNDINMINDDVKNNLILEYSNDIKKIDIENSKRVHALQTEFDMKLDALHNKYKNEISAIKNDNNISYNNDFIKNNEYIESLNLNHIEDISTIISKHEYDLNFFSTNLRMNHSQEISNIMEINNDLVNNMNEKYDELIIQRDLIDMSYRQELENIQKEKLSQEIHLLNIEKRNHDDVQKIKKDNLEILVNIEKMNLENLENVKNAFCNDILNEKTNQKTLLNIEKKNHDDIEKIKKENFETLLKIEKVNFENLENIKNDFDNKSALINIEKINLEKFVLEGQEMKLEMMVKFIVYTL